MSSVLNLRSRYLRPVVPPLKVHWADWTNLLQKLYWPAVYKSNWHSLSSFERPIEILGGSLDTALWNLNHIKAIKLVRGLSSDAFRHPPIDLKTVGHCQKWGWSWWPKRGWNRGHWDIPTGYFWNLLVYLGSFGLGWKHCQLSNDLSKAWASYCSWVVN